MKIAFHTNQIGLAGTEVALYDYADYNEKILNNRSLIISDKNNGNNNPDAVEKFKRRFGKICWYENPAEIDKILEREKADIFYAIKLGVNDGIVSKVCKTGVHTVFVINQPHGDVYFYVSEWLSREAGGGGYPYVPHMITLPDVNYNYRDYLSIPDDAVVFGRYGSFNTFDIGFVKQAVIDAALKNKKAYFLFMNTERFVTGINNIIFLSGTSDVEIKTGFINTCSAMIHARQRGETFGIAVGEFSLKNKPVITYALSPERSHIEILGSEALLYSGYDEAYKYFTDFGNYYDRARNYDKYSAEFNPGAVMKKFSKVLIESP
jgi:hypothetical protein